MMPDRKTCRAKITQILGTVPTLVAVYGHQSFDFERESPVGMVFNDGTRPGQARTARDHHYEHAFIVELWWSRDANTETRLDDLVAEVIATFEPYFRRQLLGVWSNLRLDESFSQLDYPILDGIQYRRERLRLIAW